MNQVFTCIVYSSSLYYFMCCRSWSRTRAGDVTHNPLCYNCSSHTELYQSVRLFKTLPRWKNIKVFIHFNLSQCHLLCCWEEEVRHLTQIWTNCLLSALTKWNVQGSNAALLASRHVVQSILCSLLPYPDTWASFLLSFVHYRRDACFSKWHWVASSRTNFHM